MTSYFAEPEFAEGFSEFRKATAAITAGRIIEFAGIQPGQRVIDLCCGPGLVSLHVAERVGAAGELIGVDASQAMIDLARANVTASNARFIVGDAYDLPLLISEPVDHVVATSAWQNFLLDKERIVRAVHSALKRSGRFTFDVRMRAAPDSDASRAPRAGRFRERVITAIREEYPTATFNKDQDFGPFGVRNVERVLYTNQNVGSDIAFLEANGFTLVARHDVARSEHDSGYGRQRWRMEYWLSRTVPELPAEARTKILDRVVGEMRTGRPAQPRRGQTTYVVLEAV